MTKHSYSQRVFLAPHREQGRQSILIRKKEKKQRQPTLPLVCEEGRADQNSYTSKEKRHKQALSRRVFKPLILRK